jgi:hypothetical protein
VVDGFGASSAFGGTKRGFMGAGGGVLNREGFLVATFFDSSNFTTGLAASTFFGSGFFGSGFFGSGFFTAAFLISSFLASTFFVTTLTGADSLETFFTGAAFEAGFLTTTFFTGAAGFLATTLATFFAVAAVFFTTGLAAGFFAGAAFFAGVAAFLTSFLTGAFAAGFLGAGFLGAGFLGAGFLGAGFFAARGFDLALVIGGLLAVFLVVFLAAMTGGLRGKWNE